MQNLVILGATGSIGTSTLDVISRNKELFKVYGLAANKDVAKMRMLCISHKPKYAYMADSTSAIALKSSLPADCLTEVITSDSELTSLIQSSEVDIVMAAIVGASGLAPTMIAINAGKKVLLANKESLVMSGQIFIDAAQKSGAIILPVDSEHNAIFQALPANLQQTIGVCNLEAAGIENILLTGSGGPFLNIATNELKNMTPDRACKHPNWSMGPKVSVDSATMMNKGLEYIEARWLFNARPDQLKVVIHPQSVIHSMIQYLDGSVIAQLGNPDMRTPIAASLAYPDRIESGVKALDFFKLGELTFKEPDYTHFPNLALALDACKQGQEATTILNAANEEAVTAFLEGKILFSQIVTVNEFCLKRITSCKLDVVADILELDKETKIYAREIINKGIGM